MPIDRRQFLKLSGAAAGALVPGLSSAEDNPTTAPPVKGESARSLRVLMSEADGSPLEKDRAATLCARDLANDPLPQKIAHASGRARIELAAKPIQISLRLKVPAFGEVYCWGDNDGQGYTKPGNVDFVTDAAATRLRRVREVETLARREGAIIDAQTEKYIKDAAQSVHDTASAYAALAAGLHAGEQLSLARARNRIARFSQPRKDFLFGCMISGYDHLGPTYEARVRDRFNYATASWYTWGGEQPAAERINYARMDASLEWCWSHNLTPKGFGYCYMTRGATPEWIRTWPYERILPEYERVVTETMRRYAGRLKYAEIINEAHDKSNLWRLSHEQILEITRKTCAAARQGSPTVKRQINNCCLWAEYARNANSDG